MHSGRCYTSQETKQLHCDENESIFMRILLYNILHIVIRRAFGYSYKEEICVFSFYEIQLIKLR